MINLDTKVRDCAQVLLEYGNYNLTQINFVSSACAVFPTTETNYTNNGSIVEVPCFHPNPIWQVSCPSPLVTKEDQDCSYTCPLPSYSNSDYSSAKIMQGIVSWFSWVSS